MELQIIGYIIILIIIIIILEYYKKNKDRQIVVENKLHYVLITEDNQFKPSNLEINIGDSIHIRNMSLLRHTVVNNYRDFDNSSLMLQYDTFQLQFPNPGNYIFTSSLYDDMNNLSIKVN
jgi:plastocyanin